MLLISLGLIWALVFAVSAQDAEELRPGEILEDALATGQSSRDYILRGEAGDILSLEVTAESGALMLLLADGQGVLLAQGAAITDFALPADGDYYVTLLALTGAPSAGLPYELSLEREEALATPSAAEEPEPASDIAFAPGEILATEGLTFALQWESLANLDLEVRDPLGGSVYFTRPQTASGGQFGVNVNSACDTRSALDPAESVTWPAGALPTGSYEVLIYNQPLEDCPTRGEAEFTLDVRFDGEAITPVDGILDPGDTFIASVRLGADGMPMAGASGPAPADEELDDAMRAALDIAAPLEMGQTVAGLLTSAEYFALYRFDGRAGDLVSASMSASDGNLDTLLLLLDGQGRVLAFNDDLQPGTNTDSVIREQPLLADGEYLLLATRYGKAVGGTEGNYELQLGGTPGAFEPLAFEQGLPRGDLEIALTWNSGADLQLLVRDPRGDSVFDDTPRVPSGGTLATAGNVNCVAAAGEPLSWIYWPEGALVPGSYEIEVWHQSHCEDFTPVSFTLDVLVNGESVFRDVARPIADHVYVSSFIIGVDGQVQAGAGGFIGIRGQGLETLDSRALGVEIDAARETASLLESGQPVSGTLTLDNTLDFYAFEGQAGELVSVSMAASGGRLDTTLLLLDPDGFLLAGNDDAIVGESTDSLIAELALPADGRYTVVATRYGLQYGGTTGSYELLYSRLDS